MEGDGQVVAVEPPEFLEYDFREPTRIHEDDRIPRPFNLFVDLHQGVNAGMARPGHLGFCCQDRNASLDATFSLNQAYAIGTRSK